MRRRRVTLAVVLAGFVMGSGARGWADGPAPPEAAGVGAAATTMGATVPAATTSATTAASAPATAPAVPDYKNPALPFDKRVADLLARMTLEEKAAQVMMKVNANMRLGIPAINWWSEALHGISRAGTATVFPAAVGMAASWDPPLLKGMGKVTADEARAKFDPNGAQFRGLTIWAPTINMARDPRWGRTEEGYGEDPYLVGRLAVAFVKGLQGDDPKYIEAVATPKHFAVNNQEVGRMNRSFDVSERQLREYYLPAFRDCFVEGGALSVMTAFNGVNKVPCVANKWLLGDLLRDEWGFQGSVVSDWTALQQLINGHHFVKNDDEAVAAALNAGLDVICDPRDLGPNIVRDVKSGAIKAEVLDGIVSRNLKIRMKLGMFDPPEMVPFAKMPANTVGRKPHMELALQAEREAIVLLKNDAAPKGYGFEKLLPLDLRRIKSVAVIGAFANVRQFGAYSGSPANPSPTIVEALRTAVGDRVMVRSADYSDIEGSVKAAESADVAILVLGLVSERSEREGMDRSSLELPIDQLIFVDRVLKANPLAILVLEGGSPVGVARLKDRLPAMLMAWYPGEQGGNAIAETLLGQNNPAGRLPVTFYRSSDDLPPIDDYDITKGRTYMYATKPPTFVFGHGLSYTSFAYGNLHAEVTGRTGGGSGQEGTVTVSVEVSNTGERDGDEVVQLYVRKVPPSVVPRPIQQLRGFARVNIARGQMKTVTMKVPVGDLAYWDEGTHKFVVEPGDYEMLVGVSSEDIRVRGKVEVR